MRKIKIVTIGGGSSYTPELVEGFIKRSKELNIGEIFFVDVEEGKEKLEIVSKMAKRMVEAAGLNWKISYTTNRREALKDADYVTTQLRVGQLDSRILDERIPLKYGMIGQETNGAGGIFKALRTIPVILSIIEDMKELCPNAWLINFTNPANMVTEAAIKFGNWKKTLGLCNIPISITTDINGVMGLDKFSEELFFKFAGLNHFNYHKVWDKQGNEITDYLIEKIYHPDAQVKLKGVKNIKEYPYFYEQIKDLQALPCSYHRYYYITEQMLNDELEEFKKNTTRAESVKKTEAELFELYKDKNLDHKPEQLEKRGGAYYSDVACETIASTENDKRKQMVVCTLNNGAIADLPYDSVVEISSIITSHGAEPLNWGKFSPSIRGLLQLMKSMEECVVEAAVNGDYNKLLQAFIMNPLITSGNSCKEMLDEMLVANEKYLPQFKEVIEKIKNK